MQPVLHVAMPWRRGWWRRVPTSGPEPEIPAGAPSAPWGARRFSNGISPAAGAEKAFSSLRNFKPLEAESVR